jgi:hypothetical protein
MVFPKSDINTGIVFGTSLADNYIAGFHNVASEKLHSQPFAL